MGSRWRASCTLRGIGRADAEAALARLAKYTQRTVSVSRSPGRKGGSHVLAYAGKSGGTEEYALYGTPEEIEP
jgi:hypothetical protein